MPLSFPNVYLNTHMRIETLPSDILDSIRNAARPPDGATGPTEIQVQLRDALYLVRHSPTKEHLRWFHGVSRGRFIVIFAGVIQKGLAMQKGWHAN